MEIFTDQPLRKKPHIAVFSSSKVGNFVVITPLLRGLKEKYHGCTIDFFGSEVTKEFELHCHYINWRFSLYSDRLDFLEVLGTQIAQRREISGGYDLAINCDAFSEVNLVMASAVRPKYIAGIALSRDFRDKVSYYDSENIVNRILQENNWNSKEFLHKYRSFLNSNYIGEILCRIAYVQTDFHRLELPVVKPKFEIPDVLIHTTATRKAKLWLNQWSAHYGSPISDIVTKLTSPN